MVITGQIDAVAALLSGAANDKSTVSFQSLYSLFETGASRYDMHDTLEAASTRLAAIDEAIYSAIMARKEDGYPGSGFFDLFSIHRSAEYKRIAGDVDHITKLTPSQRQQIAELERARVYAHADKLLK